MPRRRTSNKPIKRRIKLDHKGDALTEMCRTFRAVKNGELPRADGVRDVAMLDKIHNGMPDHDAKSTGSMVINVNPIVSGNMFAPGKTVLLPFDQCAEAWAAYRDGAAAWSAYVLKLEPQLTKAAFDALNLVVPPEPGAENVVNLHARKPANNEGSGDVVA